MPRLPHSGSLCTSGDALKSQGASFCHWPLAFVLLILAIVYMDRLCFSRLKHWNGMKSRFARTGSQKGGA